MKAVRAGVRLRRTTPVQVDAALEVLKAGRIARAVERDDLAVEEDRPIADARPLPKCGGDSGNCVVFSLPSRDQKRHRRVPGYGDARGCRRTSARRRSAENRAARRRCWPASAARLSGLSFHSRHPLRASSYRRAGTSCPRPCPAFWPAFSAPFLRLPAPCSDCRSRSIRSTTSACCGSTCVCELRFLALHLGLDDLHQVRAVLVGELRRIPRVGEVLDERPRHLQLRLADVLGGGKVIVADVDQLLGVAHQRQHHRVVDHLERGEMLGVAQDDRGDADAARSRGWLRAAARRRARRLWPATR